MKNAAPSPAAVGDPTIDKMMHRIASLTCVALTSIERSVTDLAAGTVIDGTHTKRLARALEALNQMASLIEAHRNEAAKREPRLA